MVDPEHLIFFLGGGDPNFLKAWMVILYFCIFFSIQGKGVSRKLTLWIFCGWGDVPSPLDPPLNTIWYHHRWWLGMYFHRSSFFRRSFWYTICWDWYENEWFYLNERNRSLSGDTRVQRVHICNGVKLTILGTLLYQCILD